MLETLLKKLNSNSKILTLFDDIKSGKNVSIFDINFGAKSLIINSINSPIIYVCDSYDFSIKLKEQFESFNKKVGVISFIDYDIKPSDYKSDENIKIICKALFKVIKKKLDLLIVSSKILFQKLPSLMNFQKHILSFKKNENYDFKLVMNHLQKLNYKQVEMVERQGEFSKRGDIIDVFPINEDLPIRMEFFGDYLEELNYFSTTDYKKIKDIKSFEIAPATFYFIDNLSQLFNQLYELYKKQQKSASVEQLVRIKTTIENIKFRLQNYDINGIENYILPLLEYENNIISILPNNFICIFDDVKKIIDSVNIYEDEFTKNYELELSNGDALNIHKNLITSRSKIFETDKQKISFQNITTSNRIFSPDVVQVIKTENITNYYSKYDLLFEELKYYLEFHNTIIIYSKNNSNAVYLQNFLQSKLLNTEIINNYENIKNNQVYIVPKPVVYGANFLEEKLVIIGVNELIGKSQNVVKAKKTKRDVFTLPKIGDYVVHNIYGIGKCTSIERKKFSNFEKDYIVLEYQGGDKIYLPTEQIDTISSYISSSQNQKLSKLGTQEFLKVKARVKSSIKEMAFSLLKLYAAREQIKGFRYNGDDEMELQFANDFAFTETADQTDTIKQVKDDMESGKLMDRLICGDVGYGKTEVALRAIFKAVQNNKQVAFLAPTTILSMQHYNTCLSRMKNYLVNVEVLNRFKTTKEQKKILQDLKDGKIDVLVGTHRLLSNDVKFKNLGLLILDEEQRFGVQDKEKIKNIKNNIDVLTLSATPIPRTLHMSLSGIRDISLITTPPEGRLPVQTTVTEYSNSLLKQVLVRELERGGQAIIIYNSIEHIYSFAQKVRTLIGDNVEIAVAHGQMDKKLLENAIFDLYNGKTRIFISTTLVENGIDLPNANTLFIVDADKLGLSQLYQLKGRVGRGNKLGYAIFTYRQDKVMSEEAYKRLNALMEFTELGSGFKIAMRDLEIRGCGNIMGKEQHGHMDKVGYDMYCKLLSEAVQEIKGEKVENKRDVKIDVTINAFIPNDYIIDSDARLRVYNMLISISSEKDRVDRLKEIADLYGKNIPNELINLSIIFLLRYFAQKIGISKIIINSQNTKLEFYEKQSVINDKFSKTLSSCGISYVLNFDNLPIISFNLDNYAMTKKIEIIKQFLIDCLN